MQVNSFKEQETQLFPNAAKWRIKQFRMPLAHCTVIRTVTIGRKIHRASEFLNKGRNVSSGMLKVSQLLKCKL